MAGEEVIFGAAPEWVAQSDFDAAMSADEDVVLYDRQVRLDAGVVSRYTDVAHQLNTENDVSRLSTLQFGWMPDKGDLTIHQVVIYRGEEIIDVLATSQPEVIRRERGLEKRQVNGLLTAVLRVPGLMVGDVLRFTSSATMRDQALEGQMQVSETLVAEPTRLGFGRMRLSWPEGADVSFHTMGQTGAIEANRLDGDMVIDIALPIDEPKDMPDDSPGRYRVDPTVQLSSFGSWANVAATLAPHFTTDGAIAPGSDLSDEVARIKAATSEPIERAALALRLVQDEVTYLMDGMNGGNYLPQSPALTWDVKYGDCKAKSLLLLAMLRAMNIEADAVLVDTKNGDAVSISQPLPGAFNHMVVRAEIGGTDYWLDGTSAGTRLATMHEVPDFIYALPVRADGADLISIEQRWPKVPDRTIRIDYDLTAGVDVPVMFDVEVETRGVMAARMREPASQKVAKQQLAAATKYFDELVDGVIVDATYSYDEESGIGLLRAKGMEFDGFEYDRSDVTRAIVSATTNWQFVPDRARAAWRDIPVVVRGPYTSAYDVTYRLPNEGAGATLSGVRDLAQTVSGIRFERATSLENGTLRIVDRTSYVPDEIAPADVPAQKTAMRRLASGDPVLRIANPMRLWDMSDEELAAGLEPHLKAVAKMSDTMDDNEAIVFFAATIKMMARDYSSALIDINAVLEEEATVDRLTTKLNLLKVMGEYEQGLVVAQEAFDLAGDLDTAALLAEMMVANGRASEALDLLDSLGLAGEDAANAAMLWGEFAGDADRITEGWDRLSDALLDRPGNGALLNSKCWFAGTWDFDAEQNLTVCEDAVRKMDYASAALDSRALVYYRLGRTNDALADLDAALRKTPEQAASRFLRGHIRLEEGDIEKGKADVKAALRISPDILDQYARYGIKPKL